MWEVWRLKRQPLNLKRQPLNLELGFQNSKHPAQIPKLPTSPPPHLPITPSPHSLFPSSQTSQTRGGCKECDRFILC
ncbi:hypothetical protein [Fortiea contorta]|uniref:hypothetical protein n=1 Tax=Fortiea contorta TaxID=1892405 RepID=UPI000344ED0C|nr:hypothetical protein [Fortiea contorta]